MANINVHEQNYLKHAGLTQPEIRQQLKDMWRRDQDLVGKWQEQKKVIDENTTRLKHIIDQHG